MFIWVALQISKDIVNNYRSMSSRISAGALEKLPETRAPKKPDADTSVHGPMTWKVMQSNVWREIANLRKKQLSNYTKLQRRAWMIINLKKKMDQLENCPLFGHKLF